MPEDRGNLLLWVEETMQGFMILHKFAATDPARELRSPTFQADSLPAEPQVKLENTGVGRLSLL